MHKVRTIAVLRMHNYGLIRSVHAKVWMKTVD
jgi:hypothetical protein